MNKLRRSIESTGYIIFTSILILNSFCTFGQFKNIDQGKTYTLEKIVVLGTQNYSPQTIIAYSGLKEGTTVSIPGEKISTAVKKLWDSNLFSDIDVFLTESNGNQATIEIVLVDLPEINEVVVNGVKKQKQQEIITENKLNKGVKVTENLITTTKNYLTNKYKKQGFFNAKTEIITSEIFADSLSKSKVNLIVNIDKGDKVKISDINLNGVEKLADKKVRAAMKKTKEKNRLRVFKRSKYTEEGYKEDLISIVDKYKENGYRDARILGDSISSNEDGTITLHLDIEEGEQYRFGNITYIGNTAYTDTQLNRVLRIRKGSVYNGVELKKRIADDTKPDALDLTNLYQNNGYLFSTINPVEVSAEGNVIDLEIRILEGKPAYFNKISVVGNEKTNDHVIYRELYTKPGQLYSKQNVIRSIRELSQLGYFDAQQITPDFKNMNPNDGTVDIEYSVVERGSSQIELQGGYGGGGFIGTLGLSFNNFSIKNIFNGEAYKPVPMGDGQSLALRLQASRFFRTYSFSFMEPWLNGKRPMQFSTSLSHTQQFLYNPITRDADKNRRFDITGISVGISKRLRAPDDYFMLSQAISYQHYNLKNYNTGLFTFGNGESKNLSYTIGLSRSDTFNDPIYPIGGSSFSVSAKFSLPYSLFNNVDYKALADERSELNPSNPDDYQRISEIDQERFRWLEFYKIKFKGDWYTSVVDKLVVKSGFEFGFLGAYNQDRGVIPFERFYLGGDGLGNFSLDGREVIQLRGYPNQSLSDVDGGSIYNKFSLELRYPITLGEQAKIYGLSFLEGGASFNDFRDYTPFTLQRSAGFGLRIFMPAFGLLGIDFGHGFDPIPGTLEKNGWETHFIIGQQF